ncbi:inactive non-canonical poly(a) RNA polymerase protein trf4-2-related [Anaeramoeba flamelloides]|uniref:Inactive non-canonical poly(A) RNA polymerase protein trf4-2-related n=1 Tax=Anaeramoeba flamelloides TaxID=1746091 RepID=A0AAV7ZAF8_9EUKA|nr:inactive non-canonical poly(a) RNA polymerase protein trf4-2-related [Anaeramoeba flamelloides]
MSKTNKLSKKQQALESLFQLYQEMSDQVKRTKTNDNKNKNKNNNKNETQNKSKTQNKNQKNKQTKQEEIRSCIVFKPTLRWEPIYKYSHLDPTLKLHGEIMDFYEAIKPTEQNQRTRDKIVREITKIVKSKWKESTIEIYGSYASGCYLPFSDIDLTVLIPSTVQSCEELVQRLGSILRSKKNQKKFKEVVVIKTAKVPIVKLKDKENEISIDISFNLKNCRKAVELTKLQIQTYPPLLPLLLLIKFFLKQHNLNEPFYGGIGSYSLMLMIVSHLQMHPCVNEFPTIANLGTLLIDFFDLYAKFNYITTGISINNNGYYFNKQIVGVFDFTQPHLPYVQDPLDSKNNTTRSSYGILECREAFASAYKSLAQHASLKPILNINNYNNNKQLEDEYKEEYYPQKRLRKNRNQFNQKF